VARAGLALQLGLPRLAITELLASPVKSDEMALMATGVYSALGQHDLVLTEFFYRSPQLQNKLGQNFLEVAALGEWCLGRPEQAAEYRLKLAEALDRNNLETGIEFSLMSIFGTGTQPGGNVAQPIYNMQQNAAQSMNLADQLIFAGILYLEAGQPQKAVDLFQRVLRDIEPNTIWRLLLERYILQITGQAFKP
ncbi:MAG TPA: hypothetical protein PKD72_06045, partial [Gemmatales bacterium]|nr:hypothetical protein [Gemmatales bacterium]